MCTETLALVLGVLVAGSSAAPSQESSASSEVEEVRDLFARHDRLVEGHDLDGVADLYAKDFCSPPYDVWDRDAMLRKWQVLLEENYDVRLKTNVHGVERIDGWYAAACCRPFQARSFRDRSLVTDDFRGAFLLQRGTDGKLRQVCMLPIDLDAQERLQDDGRYLAKDLGFAVGPVTGFFTLAQPPELAELDHVRFFDPMHDRVVDLVAMTSMLEISPERALRQDARVDVERTGVQEVPWIEEPAPVDLGTVFCAVRGSYRLEGREGWLAITKLYASDDQDTIFSFTSFGPLDDAPPCSCVVADFARTLCRVDEQGQKVEGDAVPLARWVAARGPCRVVDGVWKVPGTSLALSIDDTLEAEPLPGAMVSRLRLVPKDDPRTRLLLMVFPNGSAPPTATEMLEDAKRSVTELLCGPTEVTWIDRTEQVPLLGELAVSRTLTMRCSVSGKMTVHRLLDLPFDDCHMFLQLVPGSTDEAAQDRAFRAVLRGLGQEP